MRAALVFTLCAFTTIARADDLSTNPRAQVHIEAGLEAYGNKQYSRASTEFEAAYKIDPIPVLLWSWAQAERLGGRCGKALPLYRKYLYASISKSQVSATRDMIALCEKQVAEEPAPPPKEEPSPTVPEPETRRWYRDPLGGALTVSGVVAAGLGTLYLVKASGTRDRADVAPDLGQFHDGIDQATLQRRIGAVSLVVGAALIAGGIYVYVQRDRAAKRSVVAGTTGTTLFIRATF